MRKVKFRPSRRAFNSAAASQGAASFWCGGLEAGTEREGDGGSHHIFFFTGEFTVGYPKEIYQC